MPTREEHPIDAQFRRVLADAEATPPPHIWEGVVNARRERRWTFHWFRMNGLLALLIPASALVMYVAWLDGTDTPVTQEQTTAPALNAEVTLAHAASGSTSPLPGMDAVQHERSSEHHARMATTTDTQPAPERKVNSAEASGALHYASDEGQSMGDRTRTETSLGATFNRPLTAMAGADVPGIETSPSENSGSGALDHSDISAPDLPDGQAPPRPVSITNTPAGRDPSGVAPIIGVVPKTGAVERIVPLRITHQGLADPATPLYAAREPAYVLPNGEWLFSGLVGWYDVSRKWRGSNGPLTHALDQAEARTSTLAYGLGLTRQWRSGWGLSIGVFDERSEQQFNFVDRRTEVTQEITNFMVVLNSEIIVSNSDTVDLYSTTEKRYEGVDRRNILRIPVEAHYHRSVGRLHYGLRAGLAVEITSTRQDHSLALEPEDGRIVATSLSSTELQQRHPLMLLGVAGVDLGYTLNENWSFWANPMYMAGTMPLARTGEAWSSPSRFGLQFRLSYHFIPKRTR